MTDEYWELAGVLMEVSEATKVMLAEHAAQAEAEEDAKAGERFARIEDAKQGTLSEADEKRIASARERILEKLKAGPMTYRDITKLFNYRNRKTGTDALTALAEEKRVIRADETYLLAE